MKFQIHYEWTDGERFSMVPQFWDAQSFSEASDNNLHVTEQPDGLRSVGKFAFSLEVVNFNQREQE